MWLEVTELAPSVWLCSSLLHTGRLAQIELLGQPSALEVEEQGHTAITTISTASLTTGPQNVQRVTTSHLEVACPEVGSLLIPALGKRISSVRWPKTKEQGQL